MYFVSGKSISTEKGLNKNVGNNTKAKSQPHLHLPTKPGLSFGKNLLATIKYHWIKD